MTGEEADWGFLFRFVVGTGTWLVGFVGSYLAVVGLIDGDDFKMWAGVVLVAFTFGLKVALTAPRD